MRRIQYACVVLLLSLMAILSGGASLRESVTIDEVAHIGAGVSYLQKFDLRMNQEHPPLAKVLAAIPLVIHGVRADYSDLSWPFAQTVFGSMLGEWAWGHSLILRWNDPYSLLRWARAPMLLLTLALGLCVYVFAWRLGDAWGGLLCLAAFVSTPAFLVFGPLVLTDIPVTFFSLLTLWTFARTWRSPTGSTPLLFGLCFGAALLSKFSAGLLLFCYLVFRLSLRLAPLPDMPAEKAELRDWRRLRGRYFWKGIFAAALTVYAVYFVFSWNQPTDTLQMLGHGPVSLLLRRILLPILLYFRGIGLFVLGSSRATFILGHSYPHGVWFYFPILFLLKSTLAFLLMLLLSILIAFVAKRRLKDAPRISPGMQFHWRAVWTFLLVFVAGCMASRMSISIRHFTIPIVLLILLLAPVPATLQRLHAKGWPAARPILALFGVLAVTSVVAVLRAYPYFVPFLNSLSLGRPGYTLVNDSNLDWNQSLLEVRRFVKEHRLSQVLIDEYGFIEPSFYVPQAKFWNCQLPAPADAGEWAVVSASMIEDGHNCLWLLNFPHQSLAGGSMYAFQLPGVLPQVGDPNGPPPLEAHRNLGGFPGGDPRLIILNCERDPSQLQPTMDDMRAKYEAQRKKH